jgi:GT2 family glycosyltransferase/SAM-dependent methyltransferase
MFVQTVSIIVPCRNEQDYIGPCLESLLVQLDPSIVELLIIDGRSTDGTRSIVEAFAPRDRRIRIADNPRLTAAAAMNIGIEMSSGDIIVRADAHSIYPRDYVNRLVSALETYEADNVGATLNTVAAATSADARAIARSLSHPFGVGGARFRIGTAGIRAVDTVPFGCFRRSTLDRVGPYQEALIKNEDDELNARIVNSGGKVMLLPDLAVTYIARQTIRSLWREYFEYGYFKPLALRLSRRPATMRQFVPALWILALTTFATWTLAVGSVPLPAVIVVGSYLAAAIGISVREAWAQRDVRFGCWLFASFMTLHVAYGVGWWMGLPAALKAPALQASPRLGPGRSSGDRSWANRVGAFRLQHDHRIELIRIKKEFQRRDREEDNESAIDRLEPGRRFLVEGRERAFADILGDLGVPPPGPRRVLDVGCGVGDGVARFQALGFPRPAVVGLDLVAERLSKARAKHAGAAFIEGDAGRLPFADGIFDIVTQSTVFSSILDEDMRRQAAAEMVRVMKPGGVILWYDFWWNPANRATRGVGRADLRRLFPDCEIRARRVTLAPPLARPLAAVSWRAARALEAIWLLRTHYCAAIRRMPARA